MTMGRVVLRLVALFAAITILLAGHGLQLTLLPIRAEALGWSTSVIAATGSAYFLGFVGGCLTIPSVVARVAHIRTFLVMVAIATAALLGAGLLDLPPAWLVLRFMTGFAFSGLYMVIESWLGEAAPPTRRGALLALYAMVCLLAMVGGQAFVGIGSPEGLRPVVAAALLLSLASIPIGLTRLAPPQVLPLTRFSPRIVLSASRVAVIAAFSGGLVTGTLWAVAPIVGRAFGLAPDQVGLMMGMAIGGGALAQLPAGRLSDSMDRRRVIAGLLVIGSLAAALALPLAEHGRAVLYASLFLIGAASMPLYALCVAAASDVTDRPLLEMASGILIVNSLGAIAGPLLAAPLLDRLGGAGFYVFVIGSLGFGAAATLYLLAVTEPRQVAATPFVILPRTTPVVTGLSMPPDPADSEATRPG